MAFDKKYYKAIKEFVDTRISAPPAIYGPVSLEDWIKSWAQRIPDCLKDEDYEAAQAIKDSIRDFLNKHVDEPIPKDALLKIPRKALA